MEKHDDLLKYELGTVNSYRAKFHRKCSAVPKYFKARPVPFAIKSAVESELDQLQSSTIIP